MPPLSSVAKTAPYAVPKDGQSITVKADGKLVVPDHPIIPFIEGDGSGPDIWRASVRVLDAAVEKAYGGKRKIAWMEPVASEQAAAHRATTPRVALFATRLYW